MTNERDVVMETCKHDEWWVDSGGNSHCSDCNVVFLPQAPKEVQKDNVVFVDFRRKNNSNKEKIT